MNSGPGALALVLGVFVCVGLVFLLALANLVRIVYAAKNGGLEAAPKFCPHCGEPTHMDGGGVWYPTSAQAALRGSSTRIGFIRLGGPTTRAGWTCTKCGGTADKPPST